MRSIVALRPLAALTIGLVVLSAPGCVGFASHLLWVIKGHRLPAEYAGLEGHRVAVVCMSEGPSYGPESPGIVLATAVEEMLAQNVKKIDVVPHEDVEDWIDRNGWDGVDYRDVGRGVEADRVVAIELSDFDLDGGTGLYQGRAGLTVTVYDMTKQGRVAFRRSIPEYTFPRNGPRFATETTESRFRRAFLQVLAQQAARYFYPYDMDEEFARDSTLERV